MLKNIQLKVGTIIEDSTQLKILLIKEKIKKKDRALWNIVKGGYEKKDGNVIETAVRECREEASVDISVCNFLGIYTTQEEDYMKIQINFIARIKKGEPQLPNKKIQKKRSENFKKLKWFTKEELLKIKPDEFISKKAFLACHDWINNNKSNIDTCKDV